MNRRLSLIISLILSLALAGAACASEPFMATKSGLEFKDLKTGKGQGAAAGQVATIHFVGWLSDHGLPGKELYNSRREKNPVSFVIGTDKVMPGWNEGVTGMKVGGSRMLRMPPSLSYGGKPVDDVIPANASLLFIIELVDLK